MHHCLKPWLWGWFDPPLRWWEIRPIPPNHMSETMQSHSNSLSNHYSGLHPSFLNQASTSQHQQHREVLRLCSPSSNRQTIALKPSIYTVSKRVDGVDDNDQMLLEQWPHSTTNVWTGKWSIFCFLGTAFPRVMSPLLHVLPTWWIQPIFSFIFEIYLPATFRIREN